MCGPKQSVSIDTKPSGAEVMVYDSAGEVVFQKTTPCVATLDRSTKDYEHASYVRLVKKDGYAPVQIHLSGKLNRAYLANVVNVVGLVVDPITGSMWTLAPEAVDAELLSENKAFFKPDNGLFIDLKEQVPQDLVQYLQPVEN